MPFLARWPGHIPTGSTSGALLAHLDMAATFAALVGADVPAGQCLDGVNVLPALLGKSTTGRADFVAHVGGTQGPFALRSGHWKLITPGGGGYGKAAKGSVKPSAVGPQLYDLQADPAESKNLAELQPKKLNEMQGLLVKIRGVEK